MSNGNQTGQWVNNIGKVLKSKGTGKPYIKVEKDLVLKEGDRIRLSKFEDEIDGLVERGKITKEQGDIKKEKQSFVLFNMHLMPRDEE